MWAGRHPQPGLHQPEKPSSTTRQELPWPLFKLPSVPGLVQRGPCGLSPHCPASRGGPAHLSTRLQYDEAEAEILTPGPQQGSSGVCVAAAATQLAELDVPSAQFWSCL